MNTLFFPLRVQPTGHIRAMNCARCGLRNHYLQQRYHLLRIWLLVAIPIRLHYAWECQCCQQLQACDAETQAKLAPEFKKPFWHIRPWGFLKFVAALAFLAFALLALLWTSTPSRQERLAPQLAQIDRGQVLLLEWTSIAPKLSIERPAEFYSDRQYGGARIVQISESELELESPHLVFENSLRAHLYTPGKPSENAFVVSSPVSRVRITRVRLQEMLQDNQLLDIQ
jgi:hypothetical protein